MLENGVCSVQSEASVAVVKALGLNESDTLLDCCAAPGGKTVYAATLIKNGKRPSNAVLGAFFSLFFKKIHG